MRYPLSKKVMASNTDEALIRRANTSESYQHASLMKELGNSQRNFHTDKTLQIFLVFSPRIPREAPQKPPSHSPR